MLAHRLSCRTVSSAPSCVYRIWLYLVLLHHGETMWPTACTRGKSCAFLGLQSALYMLTLLSETCMTLPGPKSLMMTKL